MNIRATLEKCWKNCGIGAIVCILIAAYVVSLLLKYTGSKGAREGYSGSSVASHSGGGSAPSSALQPTEEDVGKNEEYQQVSGISTTSGPNNSGTSSSSSGSSSGIQNPSELLPNDTNSAWAQLNPQGKGDISNINLLKAGYHVGIDTIGTSLRNANLQLRSEPPNPQLYVGPWNQSTITGDPLQVPFEINSGSR